MTRCIARQDDDVILYDDSVLSHATVALFDPATWREAKSAPGLAGGRGNTLIVRHGDDDWALRHYHRGGRIGRLLNDQFLWLGESRTRCFREWQLLAELVAAALPAPQPVAAHYRRRGLIYTADLITRLLPGVEPFSVRLARAGADAEVWARVGSCVGRFHRAGVWHADLTAHNLQINGADEIFLLDFDRGARRAGRFWQSQNLRRLRRSLHKISRDGAVDFSPRQWAWLLEGHAAALRGHA